MDTPSPFSPPFPLPNTSSKFQSLNLQRYLEQPKAQQHQLKPQQASVEQANDESLHGSNHVFVNHSATAYHVTFNQVAVIFLIFLTEFQSSCSDCSSSALCPTHCPLSLVSLLPLSILLASLLPLPISLAIYTNTYV